VKRTALVKLGAIAGIVAVAATGAAPGDQRRWVLDFRMRLEQTGEEPPVEISLSGDWVSTVSTVRPGEYDVALELANARVLGGGISGAQADAAVELGKRLARPFWVTYRSDGALVAVHFFKDMDPSDRNLLQTIATETQLVRPDPNRVAWTALERDGAGEYLAVYNLIDWNVVVKHKAKYVHSDGAADIPPDGLKLAVDQSDLRFSLDRDGDITALDGADRVRMGVPFGNGASLAVVTKVHLTRLRKRRAPELVGSLARTLPELVTSPVVTQNVDPERLRAEQDRRLIEGRTTESLLQAAMANGADSMLARRLAALFRQRLEALAAALALLRKSGPQNRITDALGSAGSPAATRLLGSLARDRTLPRALRIDALTALMVMPRPSGEAMLLPGALLDDDDPRIASAARIVSGALARAGRAGHSEEAGAIDAALIARYRKAREAGERSDLLAALGNSTGPSTVPVIEDALRDRRNPARAAAVRALRLAEGADIDRLISETIAGDEDPNVRAAAMFAADFRHPIGPVIGDALVRAARADPVDYVRSDAVTKLRQNPGCSSLVGETLAWVAEHDAQPGIRRLAREALASVSGGAK
jgi:hypothetical protein